MSEWQHKSKSYGWWHALRPSTTAFRKKWYEAELGTNICTKMTWLEGMLPTNSLLWQNGLQHSPAGWPFHGERGCLEVVCRKKMLNETNRMPRPARGVFRYAPYNSLLGNYFGGLDVYSNFILYKPTKAIFGQIAYNQVYPFSPPWSHSPQRCLLHSHTPSNHPRDPRP